MEWQAFRNWKLPNTSLTDADGKVEITGSKLQNFSYPAFLKERTWLIYSLDKGSSTAFYANLIQLIL